MHKAIKVAVRGRVQGVGFRPFVFQLATRCGLMGTVQNNMDGVKVHLEGELEQIQTFLADLKHKAPRLSKIDEIIVNEDKMLGFTNFAIIESERSGTSMLVIPVDSAVCDDCIKEMNDPNDFRYQYPFINCTQCGPRYTIIEELPYDRPYTTMKTFHMCPDCKKEYEDPSNRRHHAQPIACPKCGPKVKLLDGEGRELVTDSPVRDAIRQLKQGNIIAIKGIGGYHLCCDATNPEAVQRLRERKRRPNRPLAVMAANLNAAEEIAWVTEKEADLLRSPESPIVVLNKKKTKKLTDGVAPGMETVGIMLPYTPLHHLLLGDKELSFLVMTSANPSGMPIVHKDDKALTNIKGIADYYLAHDREILHPLDDSVLQLVDGKMDIFRRSRGFVPDPFVTEKDVSGIVAFGGQQKSTFAIGRNRQIFVGPHIGDLENIETMTHYKNELEHLLRWIDTPKSIAVIDVHPGYSARQIVKEYDFDTVMEVQHHHAHMAACLEEHHINENAFGIILDGTGLGYDGNIWGFEIFYGNAKSFKRLAHLRYTPLPGSEKCIREPWRNAAAMLISLHGSQGKEWAKQIFNDKALEIDILQKMMEKNINTVQAGTCGRLFDAVSAICGVTRVSTYDGEAAVRLSEFADERNIAEPYPYMMDHQNGMLHFDFSLMLKEIVLDIFNDKQTEIISSRFHETITQAIVSAIVQLQQQKPDANKIAALSGGSFHNRYLKTRITAELTDRGYTVLFPEKIPCNDGGLSFGQLAVAAAKRRATECVSEYQQK